MVSQKQKSTSINHGIIGSSWQIAAADEFQLESIIIPAFPQPILQNGIWYWQIHGEGGVCWCEDGWGSVLDDIAKQAMYKIDDNIYLQDEREGSFYRFLVTNVKITQVKNLAVQDLCAAGLSPHYLPISNIIDAKIASHTARKRWAKVNSAHPWNKKLWVLMLGILQITGDFS